MQKVLQLITILLLANTANAQFTRLPSGIEYRVIKAGKGKTTAKIGDFIGIILKGTCSGQTLFDTKTINKGNNGPVNFPVSKKQFNGDVMEVLALLHEGDSATIRIPQDSFYRNAPQAQRTKGVKPGEPVIYNVGVYTIKTAAQFKKEQEDYKKQLAMNAKMQADFKKQQDQMRIAQKKAADALKKQDKEISTYLSTNNISNAKKLPSGVYYTIDEAGGTEVIKSNYEVTFNYTTGLMGGKNYDSSTDTAFGHVTPAKVIVGQRQLLSGWDEAIQKFKKGSKGKIFIPSNYAYGDMKYGIRPNDTIPANSIIKIDLEIVDALDSTGVAKQKAEVAKQQAEAAKLQAEAAKALALKDDSIIQDFIKTNNLPAKKTASGLYYVIIKEGTGEMPKVNDDVTMNYTGMFLDGTKFDSNEDTAFQHVAPFNFPLGQRRVIAGWDEGVAMLKQGTKAKLILPSAIGYGAQGSGKIPANAVLQFDVELVSFKKGASPAPQNMQMMPQNIKVGQGKKTKK
jgi:FKBP-type peptidyl-prolyl cis-trans isomerase